MQGGEWTDEFVEGGLSCDEVVAWILVGDPGEVIAVQILGDDQSIGEVGGPVDDLGRALSSKYEDRSQRLTGLPAG